MKVDRALADKRLGDFMLSARIDRIENGVATPYGQGLYMPVDASGVASLRYDPHTR